MKNLIDHSPIALRHYRERIFLSVGDLAKKAHISLNKLQQAEQDRSPVFKLSQLEAIAKILLVQPIDLCIDKTKEKGIPRVIDFRNNQETSLASYELQSIIHESCNRRDNYNLVLESLDDQAQSFSLRLSGQDAQKDAELIRDFLDVDDKFSGLKIYNNDDYYLAWRNLLEAKDILIFEKNRVNFSSDGISLYFSHCPIIVLFTSDALTRRLFTMIHELVHLGLKQSGIDGRLFSLNEISDEERYCDQVAGYVLAPEDVLLKYWDTSLNLDQAIQKIRQHSKISKSAIAMQLYLTHRIDGSQLNQFIHNLEHHYAAQSSQPRSPPKHSLILKSYGKTFIQTVLSAMWQDSISFNAGYEILGIEKNRMDVLHLLEQKAFG